MARLPPNAARERQELALLVGLGNALIAVRGSAVDSVGHTFRRVLMLAEGLADQEQQALALFNLWRFYSDRGDYANCNDIASQLQRLAQQSANGAVHLTYDHVLWTMSLYAGDFVKARHHAEQGIAWSFYVNSLAVINVCKFKIKKLTLLKVSGIIYRELNYSNFKI